MIVYNLDMNMYMIIEGFTLLFADQECLRVIQLCRAPFLLMLDICETILHAFIKRTKCIDK